MKRSWTIVTALASGMVAAAALWAQRTTGGDPTIVSAHWLAGHLADPSIVVLDIEHDAGAYAAGHIPGARLVSYMDITTSRDGNSTEVPSAESLRAVFERAGVSNGSHVIVYSSTPPVAARGFFTLDYLGNVRVSYLDGGLAAWKSDGHEATRDVPTARAGSYAPHPRSDMLADAAWVRAHTSAPGVALIDTRTDGEYLGIGERHGMPSEGHIRGARQLQWEQLFTDAKQGVLLPKSQLAALYAARVAPRDTVVTYCWVGYRASVTYMIARVLGYPTKLYDGSYEDWSRRKLPVVSGK